MNTFIKALIISFFSVVSCGVLTAQYNNSAALETITPDARSAGMAGIGAATAPDAFAQHWNLAKYALSENQAGIGFSYVPWMLQVDDDSNLFYLSGYYKFGKQALSASVRYFSMNDLVLRGNDGAAYQTLLPSQYSFDVGYSRAFGNYFSLGVAIRYINLFKATANDNGTTSGERVGALAGDIGVFFQQKIRANDVLAFGLGLKNMGTKVDLGDGNVFLPMCMNLGGRYSWGIDTKNVLTFSVDIYKPLIPEDQTESVFKGFFSSFGNTIREWGLSGGAEYAYNNRYFARAGYHFGSKDPRYGAGSYFSAGLGAMWSDFTMDVSYTISTTSNAAMSNTISLSLQYAFGSVKTNAKAE